MFKKLGAHIIDTDIIAREIVRPGSEALNDIVKHFGRQCLDSEGGLDRKKLRKEIRECWYLPCQHHYLYL
jgi:dephospho-CoA kinase